MTIFTNKEINDFMENFEFYNDEEEWILMQEMLERYLNTLKERLQ